VSCSNLTDWTLNGRYGEPRSLILGQSGESRSFALGSPLVRKTSPVASGRYRLSYNKNSSARQSWEYLLFSGSAAV
jgi:hypothetical protein